MVASFESIAEIALTAAQAVESDEIEAPAEAEAAVTAS
jgi:hypothetical protein